MNLPWLSVLTTPRRPQYLRGTLASIDGQGGNIFPGRKVVFVDGNWTSLAPLVGPSWEIESITGDQPSRGSRRAVWEILHRAAAEEIPYLLYLEDDVRVSRQAIRAMALTSVPSWAGFLSFFEMNPGGPSTPGVHRFAGPCWWGNQALKLPARSLERFRGLDLMPSPAEPHSGDVWLGQHLVPAIVLPTIARHIGAVTSIDGHGILVGVNANRAGLHYAGDDANALQVLGLA